jgi:replicative superfamily II helicase
LEENHGNDILESNQGISDIINEFNAANLESECTSSYSPNSIDSVSSNPTIPLNITDPDIQAYYHAVTDLNETWKNANEDEILPAFRELLLQCRKLVDRAKLMSMDYQHPNNPPVTAELVDIEYRVKQALQALMETVQQIEEHNPPTFKNQVSELTLHIDSLTTFMNQVMALSNDKDSKSNLGLHGMDSLMV